MTLILTREQAVALEEWGGSTWPGECCGFLIGKSDGDRKEVIALRPAVNRAGPDRRGDRFSIDSRSTWECISLARRRGLSLLGFYHSHPDRRPEPSERDNRFAWPGHSCLIMETGRRETRRLRSWTKERSELPLREERLVVAKPRRAGADRIESEEIRA